MPWLAATVAALALLSSAHPVAERAATPTVSLAYATVIGSNAVGVDTFKGIPYAQPPVGSLRLKPPQPITSTLGLVRATDLPRACPQFYTRINTTNLPSDIVGEILDSWVGQALQDEGEDCLTVNVKRPEGTTSSSSLPVVFWIFGGGFEFGSTQLYDGSGFVDQATASNQPVVYVSVNYRVAGFGFMAGKQLQSEGSTNLGLRDQRLALQWVQDNIAAFGGDPTRVTIWGESAGSISTFDHTVINRGDNTYKGKPLFRGAIMDSGSYDPALDVASAPAQAVFDAVASDAGCDPSSGGVLDCIRGLSYETFLNAVNSVPGIFSYRSVNLAYTPRPDPNDDFFPESSEILARAGQVAKVPIIIGDQMDEGTLFSLNLFNVTTQDELVDYLTTYFPQASRQQIQNHVSTYSDDPADGSPFGTGLDNVLYDGFKRNAAILGDISFTLARRVYLNDITSQGVQAWSYLAGYYSGTPFLGTFHASDLAATYFGLPADAGSDIRQFYINFVNNLDPNKGSDVGEWAAWTAGSPNLYGFGTASNGDDETLQDTFRQAQYEALLANVAVYHQ